MNWEILIYFSPAIFLAIVSIKLAVGKSIYRLFNKLFGWQYAVHPFALGNYVFRVYQDVNGRLYINKYDDITYLDMEKEGKYWFALTWKVDKN